MPWSPLSVGAKVWGFDARLADGLDGIAEGAELDPREIVVMNMRVSLLRLLRPRMRSAATARMQPRRRSRRSHGNGNRSWGRTGTRPVRYRPSPSSSSSTCRVSPRCCFSPKPGSLFRHGMNDAGIGICGNALTSDQETQLDNSAVSSLGRRLALRETSLAAAHRGRPTPRATPGNHLMASAEGTAIDIEATPTQRALLDPDGGIIVHSNHFQHPRARQVLNDVVPAQHPDTVYRHARARDILGERRGSITIDDIKTALHDHHGYPTSVCNHPHLNSSGETSYTLASAGDWILTSGGCGQLPARVDRALHRVQLLVSATA